MEEITLTLTPTEADALLKALYSWDGWFSQYPTGSEESDKAEETVWAVRARLKKKLTQ